MAHSSASSSKLFADADMSSVERLAFSETEPVGPVATGSILGRLVIGAGFAVLVAFLVAGVFMLQMLKSEYERKSDEILKAKLEGLTTLFSGPAPKLEYIQHELDEPLGGATHVHAHIYGAIQAETKSIRESSPDLEANFFGLSPETVPEGVTRAIFRSNTGRTFRTWSSRLARSEPQGQKNMVVRMAVDVSNSDEALRGFAKALIAGLSLLFVSTLIIAARLVREPLAQLRQLEKAVEEIGASTLGSRLAVEGLPSELQALGRSFNDMLARVQASQVRLSNFSADVAHEIKSPLNNMLLAIDVALMKSRTVDEYRSVLESFSEDGESLARLVQDLLLVARGKTLDTEIQRQQIDIPSELDIIREYFGPVAQERSIKFEVSHKVSRPLYANRVLLQRAINNLIDNSLKHTPASGSITIFAAEHDDRVQFVVSDTGEGICPEFLPHAFDRFAVGSPSSHSCDGTGLGLSIVRSVAELHGGSVKVESEVNKGTVVTIDLPFVTASPASVIV